MGPITIGAAEKIRCLGGNHCKFGTASGWSLEQWPGPNNPGPTGRPAAQQRLLCSQAPTPGQGVKNGWVKGFTKHQGRANYQEMTGADRRHFHQEWFASVAGKNRFGACGQPADPFRSAKFRRRRTVAWWPHRFGQFWAAGRPAVHLPAPAWPGKAVRSWPDDHRLYLVIPKNDFKGRRQAGRKFVTGGLSRSGRPTTTKSDSASNSKLCRLRSPIFFARGFRHWRRISRNHRRTTGPLDQLRDIHRCLPRIFFFFSTAPTGKKVKGPEHHGNDSPRAKAPFADGPNTQR